MHNICKESISTAPRILLRKLVNSSVKIFMLIMTKNSHLELLFLVIFSRVWRSLDFVVPSSPGVVVPSSPGVVVPSSPGVVVPSFDLIT